MRRLILLVALARLSVPGVFSAPLDSTLDEAWMQWKAKFPKVYREGEEEHRRSVWEENVKMIEQHNREYAEGKHTIKMAMNQFGDMTDEEFHQQMMGFPLDLETLPENKTFYQVPAGKTPPRHLDWREKGYVTHVKYQGTCGSCWAFSATGALEALHARKTGTLVSFSEQNLLDCAESERYLGCHGGWPHLAFEYVKNNGGINQEYTYPYEGKKGPCRFQCFAQAPFYKGLEIINGTNERDLMHVVAFKGPVSVGISGPHQFYGGGILTSDYCGIHIDHAVLLVGYGTDEQGREYWIMKNSWGKEWGIEGYAWLQKGSNACRITDYAVYPI